MRRVAAVLAVVTIGMGLLMPASGYRCWQMQGRIVSRCCCPPAGHDMARLECCTAVDGSSSREPSELANGRPTVALAAATASPNARVERPAAPIPPGLRWRTAQFPELGPPLPLRI